MGGAPIMKLTVPEIDLAEEILDVIAREGVVEPVKIESGLLRYQVRKRFGWKLESVVFSRDALEKLLTDPQRQVKVEYLRRDLARSVSERREFRYPANLIPRRRPFVVYSLSNLP